MFKNQPPKSYQKLTPNEDDIIGSSSQSAVMWYLVTCECVRRRGL